MDGRAKETASLRFTRHHLVAEGQTQTWVLPLAGSPAFLEQRDSLYAVLDLFPIPLEVVAPDGVIVFVNKAFLEFYGISDSASILANINYLQRPLIHRMGMTDYMHRVFSGEILSIHNVRVPYGKIESQLRSKKPNPGAIYLDIISFPFLHADGSVACVVTAFMTKRTITSNADITKAKEYMDSHWLDDFDLEKIAEHTGFARHHLTRLFRSFMGMTPYSYYQERKVEKIKEALGDFSLSISQAFTACGASYSGGFAKAFKVKTGMTPSQYRRGLREKTPRGEQASRGTLSSKPSLSVVRESELLFQVAELFPIPIQIFAKNGDIVYINEAVLKMWNVKDTSEILGKYNLLRDPFANGQPELNIAIHKAFQGEVTLIPDVRIPLESFWEWYNTRSSGWDIEAIYTDILNFPVAEVDGQMAFLVSVFFTSRVYQGRPEVAKAREYLENHWREEFHLDKVAEAAGLSPSHLARLFKKHTGMTLYGYYQKNKVDRLKEALQNKNLSVAEAFLSCGFSYPGNFTRFFKAHVGMTPSQYRKTMD